MSDHSPEQPSTGVPEIDEVIAEIAALDADDVATHPPVFERAHQALRRGLDVAADAS